LAIIEDNRNKLTLHREFLLPTRIQYGSLRQLRGWKQSHPCGTACSFEQFTNAAPPKTGHSDEPLSVRFIRNATSPVKQP
ncbi:hypothetical protein JB92DRAFT_2784434, partial [Gautieria morchelliformis]